MKSDDLKRVELRLHAADGLLRRNISTTREVRTRSSCKRWSLRWRLWRNRQSMPSCESGKRRWKHPGRTLTRPRPSAPTTRPAQVSFTPAPVHHGPWMLQQRKTRAKPPSRTSPPPPPPAFEISTENRFAPLRETERHTVILGDSIFRAFHATGAKASLLKGKVPVLLQCSSTCGASSAVLSPSHRIQYMLHCTPWTYYPNKCVGCRDVIL
ncbi:uncharacterized protein LOC124389742 isoform X1 [Silurus meridionalis]|uniref:uncharacterized protein LOC124389742 isoform X1 n=1 Tax=Silurus meridionalis TaxID=175797 RepID=UPI001EEAC70A|nr:uncharacterized protein LOC124389742 isoform X1 [Silurus meridionalis]XP_046711163.1 uncharacterized protein LOC124389742 isoform X1 [Silurus meridionalis]XP_046711164.1 uncharacterized protein LOC124389742 isoform X1 [Silurus meridionalis]